MPTALCKCHILLLQCHKITISTPTNSPFPCPQVRLFGWLYDELCAASLLFITSSTVFVLVSASCEQHRDGEYNATICQIPNLIKWASGTLISSQITHLCKIWISTQNSWQCLTRTMTAHPSGHGWFRCYRSFLITIVCNHSFTHGIFVPGGHSTKLFASNMEHINHNTNKERAYVYIKFLNLVLL